MLRPTKILEPERQLRENSNIDKRWARLRKIESMHFWSQDFDDSSAVWEMIQISMRLQLAEIGVHHFLFRHFICMHASEDQFIECEEEMSEKNHNVRGFIALTELELYCSTRQPVQSVAIYKRDTDEFQLILSQETNLRHMFRRAGFTHGIVVARLMSAEGQEHGLAAFIVKKAQLGSRENDIFVPRSNLLSRQVQVDENGEIRTIDEDKRKLIYKSLLLFKACTATELPTLAMLALRNTFRYGALQRVTQKNKKVGEQMLDKEKKLLSYNGFSIRLTTKLATSVVQQIAGTELRRILTEGASDYEPQTLELHSHLASVMNAFISETTNATIAMAKQHCGSSAFSKKAGFSMLERSLEPIMGYE
jgi:hypothetical protein